MHTAAPRGSRAPDPLAPYVPRLVVDWLDQHPRLEHLTVDGTAVFADVSGFTALTERLAVEGKAGAEEMGDILNHVFEDLLSVAYRYGAGLVKWGGDAVLLLYRGEDHAARACRASSEMQAVMKRIGRIRTSRGPVRLAMSIGVHSGALEFFLVGRGFRELVVCGPGASRVAEMEKVAQAGEVVVSPATVVAVAGTAAAVGRSAGGADLLTVPPDVAPAPAPSLDPSRTDVDLGQCFCVPLRDHLRAGAVDHEHRQVTVCFVEFSGADALLVAEGVDALTAALADVVSTCQDAARANGVTFLSSDVCEGGGKVILIAGAPVATGDDQARVLGAARTIVQAGGRLPLRAGVTSGRVFAGDYGPPYRRVYSVTGDAVNLAARLMARAEVGQVIALPEVLEHSRTRFAATELPPFRVKGKAEAVTAVAVGERLDGTRRALSLLPLVGRDDERATLLSAADAARGGRGQVIEVVGPAGIGKTRLLEEAVLAWGSSGVLWADGDVYGQSTPYQPLHRLFRSQLPLGADASPSAVAQALTELVADVAPDLVPWLPLIGIVAGAHIPDTPEVADLDVDVRKQRLEEVVSDALGRLLVGPTLFVFNDVQLMDDATVDLVHRLAADVTDRPWLLLLARRPSDRGLATEGVVRTTMELEPLDEDASDALVLAATGAMSLPARRAAAIAHRAGGNPLFLVELAAAACRPRADDDLPGSVEEVIAARIDELEPELRSLLRAAAVMGMTVHLDLLSEVLSADGQARTGSLPWERLEEFAPSVEADRVVRFRHHLVRQCAYEGLPFRRRAELHRHAAAALERRWEPDHSEQADMLSEHCIGGQLYEKAWTYSLLAARRARAQYANADAASLYQRALSCVAHVPDVADTDIARACEALGHIHIELCEFEEAERTLTRGRRYAKADPVVLARLGMRMADLRRDTSRFSEALRWVTRTRNGLRGASVEERTICARLAEQYASLRYFQGDFAAALRWALRAVDEAVAAGDRLTEAAARDLASVTAVSGGWLDRVGDPFAALRMFTEEHYLPGQARASMNLGVRAYYLGQWNEALDYYEKAQDLYARTGRTLDVAMCMANRAEVLVDQGHAGAAEDLLEQSLRLLRGLDAVSEVLYCEIQFGRVAMRAGQWDEAERRLAAARVSAEALGQASEVLLIDALAAECALLEGRHDHAARAAAAGLTRARQQGSWDFALPLLERVRGEALVALGRRAEGTAALRTSLTRARDLSAEHDVARALAALLRHDAAGSDTEATAWRAELDGYCMTLGLVAGAL